MRVRRPRSDGFLAFVLVAAACGDDAVGTLDGSGGGTSSGESTTSASTSGSTGGAPTTSDSGATDSGATGSSSTATTGGIEPMTSSTGGETTDASTGSTGGTTSGEGGSTGPACEEGVIVCDGTIAVTCNGEVETMEECGVQCVDGVGCVECADMAVEVCDGVDNDCDALVDEDKVCAAGTCTGGGGSCVELPISPPVPLVSGCAQQFPPAATLPCPIEEPGQVFHVSADTGDDNNDGLTPDTAWRSLCKAVDAAAEGSTVRVAEGQYATAEVYIGKELTLKGGFDATFTDWDPDAHQSVFHGRLTLDHNYAVFGGFRMISNPLFADSWSYGHHFIFAGTLVRNYVEIVAGSGQDPDILNFYGILPTACPDGVSVLRCNDVYVRSDAPQTFVVSAIEYGNQALLAGKGVLDANRICQEGGSFATDAVGGYGSCFPQDVSLLLRNNVIEKVGTGNALDFYSCGEGDMDLTLTNNTILSGGAGIQADGDPVVMMRWKLTNNIVFSGGGGSSAIDVGGAGVEITTSEHNLTFGFQSNAILPAPLMSANDDTSGVATQASVFVDANAGDFHPKPGGEAAGTGLNVFSLPDYGAVTQDLGQSLRPPQGEWDRGALRQ